MGKCYSIGHIAEDLIHTGITCSTEESQQKYRLGRSVIDNWRAQTCFTESRRFRERERKKERKNR